MEPTSLSATAIKAYEACPAQFKAQYVDRIRVNGPKGSAGDMGTAIHDVLEWGIKDHYMPTGKLPTSKEFGDRLKQIGPSHGLDPIQMKQAKAMIFAWYDRFVEDPPHEIISAERRETFPLKVKDASGVHEVGVTFIWDRCDRKPDGAIKVIDYKSWTKCLTADEVHADTQVRIYALAAAIKFKDEQPPYIVVELDQLRWGPIAVRFTRDDIKIIWAWMKDLYAEILADPGTRENLCSACRWCVRASVCKTLAKASTDTVFSITTPAAAAARLAEIKAVFSALGETKDQLQVYLEEYLEREGHLEERFDNGTFVKLTPKRKRTVTKEDAIEAIGPELFAAKGGITLAVLDELLAGDQISDEQKVMLKKSIIESADVTFSAGYTK